MLKSEIKALTNALNAANEGARVRTLDFADVEAVIEEAARTGAAWTDGEKIPGSYKGRAMQTKAIALRHGDVIKVRIERIPCGQSVANCTPFGNKWKRLTARQAWTVREMFDFHHWVNGDSCADWVSVRCRGLDKI